MYGVHVLYISLHSGGVVDSVNQPPHDVCDPVPQLAYTRRILSESVTSIGLVALTPEQTKHVEYTDAELFSPIESLLTQCHDAEVLYRLRLPFSCPPFFPL